MSLTLRISTTIEALRQSRSIGFAMATWHNTHPSLQVQQSTEAGMCPAEVKAYNAHQSFIRFHHGLSDHQSDTGIELPACTVPSLCTVDYWASTPAQATLQDVADVLDFVNA